MSADVSKELTFSRFSVGLLRNVGASPLIPEDSNLDTKIFPAVTTPKF
jgi:hypothetical protein